MTDHPVRRNGDAVPRALEGASIYPVFAVNRPLPPGTAVPPRNDHAATSASPGGDPSSRSPPRS